MSSDTYLNEWATGRVQRIQGHTALTDDQAHALHTDIVETFTVETGLAWPEYAARIENQTAGIWARYADSLRVSK